MTKQSPHRSKNGTYKGKPTKQAPVKDKKPKKHSGHPAGSRHSLSKSKSSPTPAIKKDPRIGSKKPIPLLTGESQKPIKRYFSPMHELRAIEEDPRLDSLLTSLERGETLSAEESDYVETKLARHAELCDMLGIDPQQEEEDLLEKFENADINKFR